VSVRTGCYPGQEIIARLHFKGGNNCWLHQLAFRADTMPEAGTPLTSDSDAAAGELLRAASTARCQGVALATVTRLASGASLLAPAMPGASFRVVSTIDSPND